MRTRVTKDGLSVQAIAGAYVVLLGIDLPEAQCRGALGFAVQRTDHKTNRADWLQGFKAFRSTNLPAGVLVSTREHPLQTFLWSDFTARNGRTYTYKVVVMRGRPGALTETESVEVTVTMENEVGATHRVYFNRGVAGSQAYTRKFGNRRPDQVPNREAWQWLSRGLFKAMLDFIAQANAPRFGLRAAVYEFQQGVVLRQFAKAIGAGADVKIVYDARQVIRSGDPEKSKLEPAESNRRAIEAAGIQDVSIPRKADPNAISHNKFIVLLDNGAPVAVLTGSTNFTEGGIFGHSNVVHIVNDPAVAGKYLQYWEHLSKDPAMSRRAEDDALRPFNDKEFPLPEKLPPANSITTLFSPRRSLDALKWYADRMDEASSAVFLTAAFGVNDLFEEVFDKDKDYLRYIMLESEDEDMERLRRHPNNRVAVGDALLGNSSFDTWLKEQRLLREHLSGLNRHVKYIHTKYMLLDPLGDDPVVITGSANFSDASTQRNDENMLVIRGNKRVADIYLGEFMRLFKHFQFRRAATSGLHGGGEHNEAGFLIESDEWRVPYYDQRRPECKERLYFGGEAN